jgi:serine phosphatase RsbU (regulator of sigma subunit)
VANPELHNQDIRLLADDVLLFYTDGVVDTRTPGGRLGEDGLGALLTRCVGLDAGVVARNIAAALAGTEEPDDPPRDDVALLALRAHA